MVQILLAINCHSIEEKTTPAHYQRLPRRKKKKQLSPTHIVSLLFPFLP